MSRTQSKDIAERSPSAGSAGSQSLFNIYYLGQTGVDRRCTSMMPWIIEELKLKANEMNFIWLSPGPEGVSFVADNGQELFRHSYGSILQCCIAMDGISFAYIAHHERNKYFCHVFQALTYKEADKIMAGFKEHAQEEIAVPPTVTHNHHASSANIKSSGYIMSSHSDPFPQGAGEEYKLEYLGKYEVPPPATSSSDQVKIIDSLVAKVREGMAVSDGSQSSKTRSRIKSFGAKLKRSSVTTKPPLPTTGTDHVDSESIACSNAVSDVAGGTQDTGSISSTSSEQQMQAGSDVSITLTSSSPEERAADNSDGDIPTSPDDPADQHTAYKQSSPDFSTKDRQVSESTDFDTIPELVNLQTSSEFQALSLKVGSNKPFQNQKVRLTFSGVSVVVVTEEMGEIVLKKSIRTVACCAQGKKENDHLAFTSRSKDSKKYFCYLFLAKNSKMAIKILESFKSAFVHALSLSSTPAICESCPLKQMQQLCKNLEGVSTQVAQSLIQDSLATFSDTDYNRIMSDYKGSEHADHEYTQIVVLVALLRQHFQKQQEKHAHRGIIPSKEGTGIVPRHGDSSSRLRLPTLARAKIAITNSFENLRKPGTDKKVKTTDAVAPDLQTQSLNIRSRSPLFSHKTSINALLAPIATSPKIEGESSLTRTRSFTAGDGEIRYRPRMAMDEPSSEGMDPIIHNKRKEDTGSPPVKEFIKKDVSFKTPQRPPSIRTGSSERIRRHRHRHSQTPPSLSASTNYHKKSHRRTVSQVVHSWRQEIFDSVSTPTRSGSVTSSDILEDFEIIELTNPGGSWKPPKTTLGDVEGSPATRARKRWKNAISQQIILNRMDKQNQIEESVKKRKLKMHYNFQSVSSESWTKWNRLLELEEPDSEDINAALLLGVPPIRREEVWQFLSRLYRTKNEPSWTVPEELSSKEAFVDLLQQCTEYEHNIAVDVGRTFPSHPYFSLSGGGQSELHDILHAYAVADSETGYCQGLSFVTGIILMHTKDELSAFHVLYTLMNLLGYKDIYRGSLANLQTRLYQLSRLIHDFIPALHQLLQDYEVTPFFYAAPWFLTIFASQYPISFSARVFDMIFYEGTDVLFKVALSLLKNHEERLLKCTSMESICSYLKTRLPEEVEGQETEILEQAMGMEFGEKLRIFETEFQVMDELNTRFRVEDPVTDGVESLVPILRRNVKEMVEQLAIFHVSIGTLQLQMQTLQEHSLAQDQKIKRLEAERRLSSSSSD